MLSTGGQGRGEALEIRILGPVTASVGATAAALGGPKDRGILAQLSLAAGRAVHDDALIEGTWGDEHPARVGKALQNQVLRLRKSLREVCDAPVIVTEASGYRLAPGSVVTDLGRVTTLIERARRATDAHDDDLASSLLSDALREWRGDPLGCLGDLPFAGPARTRLCEVRWTAFEERVEADLACDRHRQLVPELYAAVHEAPLRENLWGQLMVALYRSGRQAEALRVFQDVRRRLDEELGLLPGPRLCAIERAIATGGLSIMSEHRSRRSSSPWRVAALRASPTFCDLDERRLERVAALFEECSVAPGDHLTDQGSEGASLYVIISGWAHVRIDGREVAIVGPGELVGEMSLVDGSPCVADVVAGTDMRLLRMGGEGFLRFRDDQGFSSRLLRTVVQRFRVFETA